MSGISFDSKANVGLANSLSNVFKLADVNGLKWVRYMGPNSASLEAPKDDPVLNSYAKLVNEGYACSWRRLSPTTDGFSGEAKDLWVFYFTSLPDISDKLAEGLQEEGSGSWEDGMTPESSTMLYRSLHNIIERSLLNENFLPLGKWFARPDSSVATDGSSRGCFLCSFSFFVHAHLYICASVDMRAGPCLQPLLPSHINQALASSTGLQVILSPSGLNAVMTGHSYKSSDAGIEDILEEWKLFFQRRFTLDPSPGLPAAIEVILGGVRMRYPSQFVFVYHGNEGTNSSNAPSHSSLSAALLERKSVEELMQGTWDMSNCADTVQQYKDVTHCRCQETASNKSHSHRRLSSTLDLPLRSESLRQGRYEPYPSSSSRRARELATPALNLGNTPVLAVKRKLSHVDRLPRYGSPLCSPALLPSSPTPLKPPTLPLPAITINTTSNTTSSRLSYSVCEKPYNQVDLSNSNEDKESRYGRSSEGWWDCLTLPDSPQALARLQLPRTEKDSSMRLPFSRREGLSSPGGVASPLLNTSGSQSALSALLSPTAKKAGSPLRYSGTLPTSNHIPTPTTPAKVLGERPTTPKRCPSLSNSKSPNSATRGKGRGRKESDVGIGLGSVDKVLHEVDGLDNAVNSPMSMDGDPNGSLSMDGVLGGLEMLPLKSGTIDVFSDSAVKIEEGGLDQIFASDEEDEGQESEEATRFLFGLEGGREDEKMETTTIKQHTTKQLDPIELSRIYPTPPSVEALDEKFEESRLAGDERGEHTTLWEASTLCLGEEALCVPPDFAPLPNITCFRVQLPKHCIYTPPTPSSAGGGSESQLSMTTNTSKSEPPKKFIFPPPSTLATRAKIESFTLPLAAQQRARISPHIFTPQLLSSSPGFPPRGPNRFLRHFSSASATPLESPFDVNITPTPLSATTNRLMPVLPEAHALYINLSLLDSALGANLSEMLSINTGPLMSTLQSLMAFTNKRLKLDSVDSMAALESSNTTSSLPNLQEEKPIMTFGIADYPSLGFRDELRGMMGASTPSTHRSLAAPYGCLSKFVDLVAAQESSGGGEEASSLFKFLEQLQDYCLHLCFTGCHDNQTLYNTLKERSKHTHLMVQSLEHAGGQEEPSGQLYHSTSVVSAVMNAKQLVVSAGKRLGTPLSAKPSTVTLSKEDNSAAWILGLLTLPTKFITKRLKELRSVFQSSFHHAPCLRFSTKGPLTLKDLQQLTPSQTALGDDCSPLPMQPVMVGYDHEWLAVSPLALPAWEKLLFEPYAMQKNVVYLVLAPATSPSLAPAIRKYFRDLSIVFKNCNLGHHLPLEKNLGEDGIVTAPASESSSTEDPRTNTRHGAPAGLMDVTKFCKKVLAPYLSSLPVESTELMTSYVSTVNYTPLPSTINRPTPPLSIMFYVVCSGGEKNSQECFRAMHAFSSELLSCEEIPAETKERLILQLVDSREIFGQNAGRSSQLQSLAFSVYTRCRPNLDITNGARSLTSFGPTADKMEHAKSYPCRQLFAPPFVLSSNAPLASTGPLIGTQTHHILFNPEEAVLFCGYCVSPDQRWLLVACCDRQGELLDTSIIGIHHPNVEGSRLMALQKLWNYILSIVAGNVLKWNIVITRFGKPSNSEIRDWPALIVDDGLLTANQLLTSGNDCTTCIHTSSRPHLTNVIMVSVQPERNIQLFPVHDPAPSISHVMVLPPDPCSSMGPCMTPSAADTAGDEFDFGFAGVGVAGDMGAFPMDASLMGDLNSELSGIDLGEEFRNAPLGMAQGVEETLPKATGYLISTSPPGDLPDEFWGHDKPQTLCTMFKVLLHCHRSEKALADSPQETLGSILLCFDALSWLAMDHSTQQRRSCLPLHLFTLSKLYHLFTLLEQCQ